MSIRRTLLILLFLAIAHFTNAQNNPVIQPVELQLKGYNNRDIETFAKAFSDTVKVYRQPGVLTYKGIEELRKRYGQMFENTPDLHCEIVNRIVADDVVIDHEKVRRSKDKPRTDAIAVYRVKEDKIIEVTFISPNSQSK